MVQEEVWVSWGGKEIASGVTTGSEVTRGVHTQETSREVTLHVGRKGSEVGVVFDE